MSKQSSSTHSSAEAGFTLLELLIAMTLLGLLTVLMFGGFRFGTQAWAKAESVSASANEIRSMQSLLADELARAYPAFIMKIPTDPHIDFDGTQDTMSFLGPDPAGAGGMARITILAHDDDGHVALAIRAEPELASAPEGHAIGPKLRGFETIAFAYYGADTPKDGPYWHEEWRDRKSLPLLIRIRATFAKGKSGNWPDMVVAPRIAADAGCVFDALTKFCQGR